MVRSSKSCGRQSQRGRARRSSARGSRRIRVRRGIALRDRRASGSASGAPASLHACAAVEASALVTILRRAPAVRVPRARDAVARAGRVGRLELAPGLALRRGRRDTTARPCRPCASSSYGMTAMRTPVDAQNRNVPVRLPWSNAPSDAQACRRRRGARRRRAAAPSRQLPRDGIELPRGAPARKRQRSPAPSRAQRASALRASPTMRASSPTMPRRNASTQTTKMTPVITVTHWPKPAR